MENEEKYNFVVVPLNVLGTVSVFVKDTEEENPTRYDDLMNDFISKFTTHPEMGELFHRHMLELTKIAGKVCEGDEKFKDFIPSFVSLLPQSWYPELDEQKRKFVFDFSETFRKEMEQVYDRQTNI